MHEEHLARIAQTMKELYHVRRNDANANDIPGTGEGAVSRGVPDKKGEANPRFPVRNSIKNVRPVKSGKYKGPQTEAAQAQQSLSAIKCFRCGDAFPVTDFLYTKETGLCIQCWEAKIKVI
jgi:hypothetical protein